MDVLNPGLYRRLVNIFGDVKICNPGQPLIIQVDDDLFETKYRISVWGESYRVNCPFCYEVCGRPDRRQRLYISHKWGQVVNGRRCYTLAKCFNEDCIKGPNVQRLKEMILTYGRLPDIKYDPQTIEPMVRKEIRLPTNIPVLELPETHPARQFLIKRGIDKDQALCYDIRYGQDFDPDFPTAYNTIIFPVYMEQALASWQARVLASNSRMKYYSCPGTRIHDLLYGWDLAKDYDYAILVEGIFDAIRVGPPALALFGKHVSERQARLLQRFKTVFYLPDSDVPKDEIRRNIASLKIYRVKTVPVIMSQVEDPAELDPVDIQRMKEAFERMVSDGVKVVR
jgi:hypothetical protein